MSFLNNIFSSKKNTPNNNGERWSPITGDDHLENAVRLSYENKVVIFKHSTGCGVSRMALKKFENEMALLQDDVAFFFLDLLAYRDLSNKIAKKFGIVHQSPQIIVLKDGKAVRSASHEEISITIV